MDSDAQSLMERLNTIEAHIRRIEDEIVKGSRVIVLDEAHLKSTKEAVRGFLNLSERFKGHWKGTLNSVEELRKMRKHRRGY